MVGYFWAQRYTDKAHCYSTAASTEKEKKSGMGPTRKESAICVAWKYPCLVEVSGQGKQGLQVPWPQVRSMDWEKKWQLGTTDWRFQPWQAERCETTLVNWTDVYLPNSRWTGTPCVYHAAAAGEEEWITSTQVTASGVGNILLPPQIRQEACFILWGDTAGTLQGSSVTEAAWVVSFRVIWEALKGWGEDPCSSCQAGHPQRLCTHIQKNEPLFLNHTQAAPG